MTFSILPRTLRGWMIVVAVASLPMAVLAWYRRLDPVSRSTALAVGSFILLYVVPFLFVYDRAVVGRNRHKKNRK